MTVRQVDAAVVQVLTAFAGFLWLILVLMSMAYAHHDGVEHAPTAAWVMLGGTSLLLVFLLTPLARRWWPRTFLPIALAALSLIPLLGELLALINGPAALGKLAMEHSFVIVAPLLVCAWQFGLRPAIVLTLAATVFDFCLSFLTTAALADLFRHMVLTRAAVLLAAAYITTRLVNAQRAQYDNLCQANAKLATHALTLEQLATSRERNRIAREIHDTLAHTLSALAVQLEGIRALSTSDPEGANTMIERSLVTARSGLDETRRTLQALRASPIEDLGLVLALRHLARDLAARTDADLQLGLPDEPLALAADMEHGVYRIAEEALENGIRHANARRVELGLALVGRELSLRVADNGCGFATDRVGEGAFGLRGMHERARMLGGSLHVKSTPGQGTTVSFTVGLRAAEDTASRATS